MELTYYDEDGPAWTWWRRTEPERPAGDPRFEVRHGYTLTDIERLARMGMRRSIGWSLLDETGRYQAAYDGVVEALFTAEEPPQEYDLMQAAWSSLARNYKIQRRDRGLTDDPDQPHGPRFAAYWMGGRPGGFADAVEERAALAQVLGALADGDREALAAMAVHGTRGDAARALGLALGAFSVRLLLARRRALRLWFDHESQPPRHLMFGMARKVAAYGREEATHCRRGHAYTAENTRWYRPPRGSDRDGLQRVCRECERGRARRRAEAGEAS